MVYPPLYCLGVKSCTWFYFQSTTSSWTNFIEPVTNTSFNIEKHIFRAIGSKAIEVELSWRTDGFTNSISRLPSWSIEAAKTWSDCQIRCWCWLGSWWWWRGWFVVNTIDQCIKYKIQRLLNFLFKWTNLAFWFVSFFVGKSAIVLTSFIYTTNIFQGLPWKRDKLQITKNIILEETN